MISVTTTDTWDSVWAEIDAADQRAARRRKAFTIAVLVAAVLLTLTYYRTQEVWLLVAEVGLLVPHWLALEGSHRQLRAERDRLNQRLKACPDY